MNSSVLLLRQPLSLLSPSSSLALWAPSPVAPPSAVIAILWRFAVMETEMAADNAEVSGVWEFLSHILKSSS